MLLLLSLTLEPPQQGREAPSLCQTDKRLYTQFNSTTVSGAPALCQALFLALGHILDEQSSWSSRVYIPVGRRHTISNEHKQITW